MACIPAMMPRRSGQVLSAIVRSASRCTDESAVCAQRECQSQHERQDPLDGAAARLGSLIAVCGWATVSCRVRGDDRRGFDIDETASLHDELRHLFDAAARELLAAVEAR